MTPDDIDTEPADEFDDLVAEADRVGRFLLAGVVTCAVLAAVGIAGSLWGAW